jgi:hypothetical protein
MSCTTRKTFVKDPDSTLDYTWDWTEWLGEDVIDTAIFTAETLTINLSTKTDKTATVWLSGGVPYKTYKVTCRITTPANRTEDRTVKVFCAQH